MQQKDDLAALYRERSTKAAREAEALARRGHRIGNLRGVSFATFVIAGGISFSSGSVPAGGLSVVGLICFLLLIPWHDRVLAREQKARRRALQNEHAHSRVTGEWHELPRTGMLFAPKEHPYASDLDLFGVGSLYQRISVAHTRYGQKLLAEWLLTPSKTQEEISARAEAMLELSSKLELRQEFEAEGMALVEKRRGTEKIITDGPDPQPLLNWVRAGTPLPFPMLLSILSFLLPVATLTGIILQIVHGTHPIAWAAPLLTGVALLSVSRKATGETFAAVSTTEGAFLRYGALLNLLENLSAKSPWIQERVQRLATSQGKKPSSIMGRFRRLVGWYDLRHNGMVYPFINALLLWDLHCTRALLAWRLEVRGLIDTWFQTIGEMEALSSLAGLYHDDPGMSVATITMPTDGEPSAFSARGLGHPLLSPQKRVENDVAPFAPGQALLVTGSNMSGKSTFLRSIGVNTVLAFAGGPVCARELSLPFCHLGTSIRIADSLASGVSHFYAEVQRLAAIVRAAKQQNERSGMPVLFLLDEILHGTNSRERQIGARWVLAELLEQQALGVVTTHDMELCRLPDHLMDRVRQHHFRESVSETARAHGLAGSMTFDYTLHDGPVRSGNALRLMRRVGLDVPLEGP